MSSASEPLGWAERLAIIGVVLVGVSMVLSWITAPEAIIMVDGSAQESMAGYESGDGQLVIGGVAILMIITAGVRYRRGSWGYVATGATVLAGLLAVGVATMYILDPATGAEGAPEVLEAIDAGIGLFVAAAGGLALVAAGLVGVQSNRA